MPSTSWATHCVPCGARRVEGADWCSFCPARYEPLPRPRPRRWEATPTRHGVVGRLVWVAVLLPVLWAVNSALRSFPWPEGMEPFLWAAMGAPLALLWWLRPRD